MQIADENNNTFRVADEEPTERDSHWYPGKVVQGHKFSLHVRTREDFEYVKDQLVTQWIKVDDGSKRYRVVKWNIPTHSYVGGEFTKGSFDIQVEEDEDLPEFSSISINDRVYSVVNYSGAISNGQLRHSFLLVLNEEEFNDLEQICVKKPELKVLRIGVDETPLIGQLGGRNYWSEVSDEESEALKFHRIFNLSIGDDSNPKIDYLGAYLRAGKVEDQVLIMGMQIQYLIGKLEGILSKEDVDTLNDISKLVNNVGCTSVLTGFEEVRDAEEVFNLSLPRR